MKAVKVLSAVVILVFSFTSCIQKKVLVQNPENGKDVYVHEHHPDRNFGTDIKVAVMAWTFKGSAARCRGLISFDLSSIPSRATITKAELFLYHIEDQGNNPRHSALSGSNASVIQQITSRWEEDAVTWNNQPASTTEDEAELTGSVSENQDYVADVTRIVQRMVRNPSSNHGFLIQLKDEEYYRALMFSSSDHSKRNLHPALKVSYTLRRKRST